MARPRLLRVYHRLESPTQTPEDAARQVASGEIWGRAPAFSYEPRVKAFRGPLPTGARGIEFITDLEPDSGSSPRRVNWSGPREGVIVEGEFAKIKAVVIRNTQA